jgi:hypothetical protein
MKGIDKKAQAKLGWQPASRYVRRKHQAERFQITHHIADCCRRQCRHRIGFGEIARQRARAQRLTLR